MIGIKPIGNESEWTDANKIYDEIDVNYGDDLYLHTVDVDRSVNSPANILRYDVALVAKYNDTQICVNDFLVSELELAEYDENTRHHLKKIPNFLEEIDSDSNDSDWDKEIDIERKNNWPHSSSNGTGSKEPDDDFDFDFENAYVHFEEDDLLALFPGMVKRKTSSTPNPTTSNPTLQKIDEVNEMDLDDLSEQAEKEVDRGYVSTETDGTDASSEHYDVNHQVEYIFKRPKVNWWQTEEQLILRISAHDNVQYGLEITTDYLIYA